MPALTFCPRIPDGNSGKDVTVWTGVTPPPIPNRPSALVEDPAQKFFGDSEDETSFWVLGRTKLEEEDKEATAAGLASLDAAAAIAAPMGGRGPGGGRLRTGISSLERGLASSLQLDEEAAVVVLLVIELDLSRPSSKAFFNAWIS